MTKNVLYIGLWALMVLLISSGLALAGDSGSQGGVRVSASPAPIGLMTLGGLALTLMYWKWLKRS